MTFLTGELPDADKFNRELGRCGVRARRVAVQSIANVTASNMSWDTQDEDTDNMFAPTSTTITIPFTGIYAVTVTIDTALVASVRNIVDILPLAGTGSLPVGTPFSYRGNWTSGEGSASVSASFELNAGNAVACGIFHTMGAAQNFTGSIQCFRVGS